MKCEACRPLVEELFDGELEPPFAPDVRAHLKDCASCSGYYESLLHGQDIFDTFLEGVELSPAAWRGLHTTIQGAKAANTGGFLSGFFKKHNWLGVPRFQQAVFAAILAVVVIGIGIAALRFAARPEGGERVAGTPGNGTSVKLQVKATPAVAPLASEGAQVSNSAGESERRRSEQEPAMQNTNKAAPVITVAKVGAARAVTASRLVRNSSETARHSGEVASTPVIWEKAAALNREMDSARSALAVSRPTILKTELARHFEKTRLLLLSLKNTQVSKSDTAVNVSYEKRLSRKLADSNLLLRRDVATLGDPAAAELLDRVEPLLLEIANLPDRASPEEVALVSRRIAGKEVISLLQAQAFSL